MRTTAFMTMLAAALCAEASDIARTADEANRMALAGVVEEVAFDITATVATPVFNSAVGAFEIVDGSGYATVNARRLFAQGRHVEVGDLMHFKGAIRTVEDGISLPVVEEMSVVGRGTIPDPEDVSAADVFSGRFTSHRVRLDGTVVEAFRDEANPEYTFIVLVKNGDTMYFPSRSLTDADLAGLVDARVSIVGVCSSYRGVGPRARLGYEVNILDRKDITIITPPPAPFDVPDLEGNVHDILFPDDSLPRRRKLRGRVAAVWMHGRMMMLKAPDGSASTVALSGGKPPAVGDFVEAAGLPETDFYHLNLTRAIWRRSEPFTYFDMEPESVAIADLVADIRGLRKFDVVRHGRILRVAGTVIDSPDYGAESGTVLLSDGGKSLAVDIGSVSKPPEPIEPGYRIEVDGVCVMDTENWRPQAPFPHVTGVFLVLRNPDDVRVLARPSWWTPKRLLMVIGALFAALLAILVWNRALGRLAVRRGRELFREQVTRAKADMRTEERTRLAVELHDSVAQNLTGISLELETALDFADSAPPDMRPHLDFAAKALKSCRNDLRNCIWDLRGTALEDSNLNETLGKALRPHLGEAELALDFDVPRDRLSDSTVFSLFKAIRELVINAVRHGGAKKIEITGRLDGDGLVCRVRDDGRGFDPETSPGLAQGHFGLQGIRERIGNLGGRFTIASEPGHGAEATISLPAHFEDKEST